MNAMDKKKVCQLLRVPSFDRLEKFTLGHAIIAYANLVKSREIENARLRGQTNFLAVELFCSNPDHPYFSTDHITEEQLAPLRLERMRRIADGNKVAQAEAKSK